MIVEKIVRVEGMSCAGCAKAVENALRSLEGVKEVEVKLEEGVARVKFDDELVNVDKIAEKIEKIGYKFGGEVS
ncbi:heavy-metal-associated domain-containing protein [Ferroglobus placidus]|nr:cation transporter [Ferroglobus placidus]